MAAERVIGRRRTALALRGIAAVLVVLLGGAGAVVVGTLDTAPAVTARLPADAGPVRARSAVQHRGVRVGEVAEVRAGPGGADLLLRIDPRHLDDIPAGVRVRLLPRTLFGDQYLDLVPGTPTGGTLTAGARLEPDTSTPTIRLYDLYSRAHRLLVALEPAELQVALAALAEALAGRGERLGEVLDQAAASAPVLARLGADLATVAELGADLAEAAPDLLAAMEDATVLSGPLAGPGAIDELLSAGLATTGASRRFLDAHAEQAIRLVRSTEPIVEVLAEHPTAFSDARRGMDRFLDGANRAFATGFFRIRAAVTLDDPHPYDAADCPRYPGLDGPNCAEPTSTEPASIGPVGGPAERDAMRRLAPLLPPPAPPRPGESRPGPPPPEPSPDLLGVLLAPLVRGTEVVVP
ncbi:MCE family protein [Saccharopolyspora cebuensis]|uniref:MCE family protein n=1 Tax=Saccharopolyspora cebuensis TaxID=418759 RepID=A0ABV4CLM0_9PSEU